MGFKEKEVLIYGFLYANFSYCSPIWHFCAAMSVRKIKQPQTRALKTLYKDFDNDYKTLLDKSDKCTMKVKCLRTLGLEVFKALNNANPAFMGDIFHRTK